MIKLFPSGISAKQSLVTSKKISFLFLFVTTAFFASLSACTSVRILHTDPGKSGVLAFRPGLVQKQYARDQARSLIRQNCKKKGHTITQQGEYLEGEKDKLITKKRHWASKRSTLDGTVEWRIFYRCKTRRAHKPSTTRSVKP